MDNTITILDVSYIRPDRTIETIFLRNYRNEHICYVYNFEGVHYRFFKDLLSLVRFFDAGEDTKYNFSKEETLDNFLIKYSTSM